MNRLRRILAWICCLGLLPLAGGATGATELPSAQMRWPAGEPQFVEVEQDYGYVIIGRGSAKLLSQPTEDAQTLRYLQARSAMPIAFDMQDDDFICIRLSADERGYVRRKEVREPEPEEIPAYALDTSCAELGYVHVAARGSEPLLAVVENGERRHHTRIPPDGYWHPMLLTLGTGEYEVSIQEAGLMDRVIREQVRVELGYLEPPAETTLALMNSAHSDLVKNRKLVQYAKKLCEGTTSDWQRFTKIRAALYRYARYDREYARSMQCTKIPEPEIFLKKGNRGICGDYAAYVSVACRAVGLPCKTISGVNPKTGNSHAWNEVYIDGEWLLVDVVTEKSNEEKDYAIKRMQGSAYRYVPTYWGGFD